MSYCRFSNTLKDLKDCNNFFWDTESKREAKYRLMLFNLCKSIVDKYGDEESIKLMEEDINNPEYDDHDE
jgi:hypothetical protein